MLTDSKKGLISIDIARAFAALGVFSYHQHIGEMLARYSGINFFNFADAFGAYYAVPLFFLISGYCIHLSNLKYVKAAKLLPIKEYYKRRLLRIYPPYIVAVLFSIIVNSIVQVNNPITWGDFFIHLFLLQGFSVAYFNTINVVLWTISIELAFYILYPVFYYLRLKFSLNKAILFTLIVSGISIVYLSGKSLVTISQFFCVFNLWFAWCCGAYMADKKTFNENDLKKPAYKIFYAFIVFLFVGRMFYHPDNLGIISYQVNILIWTAPLLFLINTEHWLAQKRSLFINLFVAIGLSSYSLYLFHQPLIILKNFVAHACLPKNLQPAGVFIGVFIIPVITWFSYLYIEKPFLSKKRVIVIDE